MLVRGDSGLYFIEDLWLAELIIDIDCFGVYFTYLDWISLWNLLQLLENSWHNGTDGSISVFKLIIIGSLFG